MPPSGESQNQHHSVFDRLYNNAKDLTFKREFQKQVEIILDQKQRDVGKRLTLSGS